MARALPARHAAGDDFGDTVTWAAAAELPLCLLSPDMQHRRIVDRRVLRRGGDAPARRGEQLGLDANPLPADLRAIPLDLFAPLELDRDQAGP